MTLLLLASSSSAGVGLALFVAPAGCCALAPRASDGASRAPTLVLFDSCVCGLHLTQRNGRLLHRPRSAVVAIPPRSGVRACSLRPHACRSGAEASHERIRYPGHALSTPSFERHRGHNTASRPYSIAARLLKRDLVAIPSGQLNTPLRAGIAPGPATARRLAGTLALRSPERHTAARTHARRPTPAPAAHATATPRRDVRTARSAAYPSAVSLAHALAIVPQAFGVPG